MSENEMYGEEIRNAFIRGMTLKLNKYVMF